jgi:hypothetical protein
LRDPKAEPGICHGIFGVATIELIAGKPGAITKIFASGITIDTVSARSTEPGDSNPLTHLKAENPVAKLRYVANNLVAWNERELGIWKFPINHVQISAANRTGTYLNQDLIRVRLGDLYIPENQRLTC